MVNNIDKALKDIGYKEEVKDKKVLKENKEIIRVKNLLKLSVHKKQKIPLHDYKNEVSIW
jgi:hypothetical protein